MDDILIQIQSQYQLYRQYNLIVKVKVSMVKAAPVVSRESECFLLDDSDKL